MTDKATTVSLFLRSMIWLRQLVSSSVSGQSGSPGILRHLALRPFQADTSQEWSLLLRRYSAYFLFVW